MADPISSEVLARLRPLEKQLKFAQKCGSVEDAELAMQEIQNLLKSYKDHHRLLECKLWYFETLLDANHTAVAESGFVSIRRKAARNTRLYLESTFFLSVCFLRQKRINEAKPLFKEVLIALNKEQIAPTRRLLQKRIIERIEEESILTELIGAGTETLNADKIQVLAIQLVQKPEDEIFELLGRHIPYEAYKRLQEIREHAVLQLPVSDRKLLGPPGFATKELSVGKRAFAVLKRVGWKTLCDTKSPIYKLWSKKIPEVYSGSYFSAAVVQSFNNWKIGLPFLAAGIAAVAMKYGAVEFCEATKPESIMEIRRKK
jgi:hypothetical protein